MRQWQQHIEVLQESVKPTDDEIEGPEHYAAKIAAIEAADVSIIQSVVMVVSQ